MLILIAASLVVALFFGAATGFPVFDDAEFLLLMRERGLAAIPAATRDRPLYGFLALEATRVFGERPAVWAAVGVAFCALLAWQTARLARRLFPEDPSFAVVAGLLALAPIVIQTQFTTLTTVLQTNLPVSLTLEAILLQLGTREGQARSTRGTWMSFFLAAAAAAISEYAVATMAAGAVLLLFTRPKTSVIAPAAGAGLGYLCFRMTADLAARPDTMVSVQLGQRVHKLFAIPAQLVSGVWCSLFGAYARAVGSLRIDAASRTTILSAVLAAGAACVAMVVLGRQAPSAGEERPEGRRLLGLAGAVAVGLLPVVLAGRDADLGGYDSRFRLPVLAFAVVATVYALRRFTAARWRPLAGGFLVFLAVGATWNGAFEVRRERRFYDDVGKLLLPLVRESGGIVVAVLPEAMDAMPTGQVAARWAAEDERRLWVTWGGRAEDLFGPRGECRAVDSLDVAPRLRVVGRHGPIARLLWVSRRGDTPRIESYCGCPPPSP